MIRLNIIQIYNYVNIILIILLHSSQYNISCTQPTQKSNNHVIVNKLIINNIKCV